MTITFYNSSDGGMMTGLSTDTKPVGFTGSVVFIETDTGKIFKLVSSVWTLNNVADSSITTSDITTNNASTSKHGWFPKLPTATNKFLRDDMTWQSPPGGSEAFPINSIFISVVSTNPNSLLGYGTWSAFGAGRVLVGLDAGQTEFDTVEETGGAKTHTLDLTEIPSHNHNQQRLPTSTGGVVGFTVDTSMSGTATSSGVSTGNTGGGSAHNNLQPYIVVYMWKRTA